MAETVREIECRWLLKKVPKDLKSCPFDVIKQGYLTARIRSINGREFLLEVKAGKGLSRIEVKSHLSEEQFRLMWPETRKARLKKRRYKKSVGENIVEIDIYYSGKVRGHRQAEVEFPSEEAADSFKKPKWFGKEVTNDSRYGNHSLAVRGRPKGSGKK